MEIKDINKFIAVILTYIRYKDDHSWNSANAISNTYMGILEQINDEEEKVEKSDFERSL